MAELVSILRERFLHAAFRPHQEAACAYLAEGADVLLDVPRRHDAGLRTDRRARLDRARPGPDFGVRDQ